MSFKGVIGEVVGTGRGDGEISSFEWRIPDFLSLAAGEGDRYGSPEFNACGGRWWLKIYTNGLSGLESSGWVSLLLFRNCSGSARTLDVTLGIRGAVGVEKKRGRIQEFSDVDYDACLWSKFCSRSELTEQNSRLMPGNMLIVSLEIKIDAPSVARGVEALQKSLQSLLAGGEDSDVLIKVRGKQFPAHRNILRARSPVFRAMFAHDTVEKQSGVVTMEDCDPETFPDFLEHVYTGSVEMISLTNVFNLYAASDKYDLSTLKEECADFMKRNLTVASFCNIIALAIQHGDQDLIESATAFFCDNSIEIAETAEWQTFLQENSIVGNKLFIKTLRHNLKK